MMAEEVLFSVMVPVIFMRNIVVLSIILLVITVEQCILLEGVKQ